MIIRVPSYHDIEWVVAHMREWDKREIFAVFDQRQQTFVEAYYRSVKNETLNYVAYNDDGEPVALMSVVRQHYGRGMLQMLATDGVSVIIRDLTRFLRGKLSQMEEYGLRRLECLALKEWQNNTRWLQSLGGVVEAEVPRFGANGEDYLRIVWSNDQ